MEISDAKLVMHALYDVDRCEGLPFDSESNEQPLESFKQLLMEYAKGAGMEESKVDSLLSISVDELAKLLIKGTLE